MLLLVVSITERIETMIELAKIIQDRIDSNDSELHKEAVRMFEQCTSVVSYMDSEYVDKLEELWNEYKSE